MARLKSSSSSKSPLPSPKSKSPNPKPPEKSLPNPNPKTPTADKRGGGVVSVKGLTKEQEEEDYMKILQAVADFTTRNGSIPTPSTMKPVHEAVKGELHQKDLTVDQLYNKFRTLKERYRRVLDSGAGPTSAERAFLDLSVVAWGELKRKNPPPPTSKEMEKEMNSASGDKKQKLSQEEEKREKKKKKKRDDDNDAETEVHDSAVNEKEKEKEKDKKKEKGKEKEDAGDDHRRSAKKQKLSREEEEKKKRKDAADDDDDVDDDNEMENDKKGKEKEDGGDDHKFRYLRDQATKYFKLHGLPMHDLELGLKFMDRSKAEVLEMRWRKFLDIKMKNESRAHSINKDLLATLAFYFRKV